MESRVAEQPILIVEPEDVRVALERILTSKYFINAHRKKKFLRLICDFYLEDRAQELNEYILGYDVCGRGSSYNPSGDPIVRVLAYEIRKKLEAYYTNEGANDPIRLEIPAGSYQPVFTRQFPQTIKRVETAALAQAEVGFVQPRISPGKLAIMITMLFLSLAVIMLALSNRQLRQEIKYFEVKVEPSVYGPMWDPFLGDRNPPLVILSNPPVFRFTNPSDPETLTKNSVLLPPKTVEALKDKFVTNPEVSIKESSGPANDYPRNEIVIERNQTPRLILSTNLYTGIGEAIGLHYLTDFFNKAGRNILLKQSRTLSAEDLKTHNVILLGGAWMNEWSGKLIRSEDLLFTSKATIENRDPQPGEEREYIPEFDRRTGSLIVDYAIITVKPNITDTNEAMLLAGIYSQGTQAAVEYVTNKVYLDQLNQRLYYLKESGYPLRYFQALLKVGVENGIPTTISIMSLHELRLSER